MASTALDNFSDLGVRVAIADLPLELAQIEKGNVYCIAAASAPDLCALGKRILVDADVNARVALIADQDFSDFLDAAPVDCGPGELRIYTLKRSASRGLVRLSKDLERALNPRDRLLLIMLEETSLPSDSGELTRLMEAWKRWLSRNDCSILLMCHGPDVLARVSDFVTMNESLSGLAVLEGHESDLAYRVHYWRSRLGVIGSVVLPLVTTDRQFHVVQHAPETSLWSSDQNRFFLDRDALEGTTLFMASEWHICDDWSELYQHGMTATAATVVFALSDHAEVPRLAKILHTLRKQRGPALKLVVRAEQRPLRYYDEQLLLESGATMVVPANTHLSGFLGLLEAVQQQRYTRELTGNVERLLEMRLRFKTSGEIPVDDFIQYLERLAEPSVFPATAGVLVQLVPVPGLSAEQAMTQLRIRRTGDIASHLNGIVYLFLAGCRPALVEAALGNVFRLPYKDIFSEHRFCYLRADIIKKTQELRQIASTRHERAAKISTASGVSQKNSDGGDLKVRASTSGAGESQCDAPTLSPRLESLLVD